MYNKYMFRIIKSIITRNQYRLYHNKVIDHYENPRNVGSFDANEKGIYSGLVGATSCGDVIKLELKISDKGIIEDAKFKTFGCCAAIATSSMITEMVKGKTLEEAEKISKKAVASALDGLPPAKMHCSNLAADALHGAIKDYKEKHES